MLALHADWSVDPAKRWMAVARRDGGGWALSAPRPVGDVSTLFARLRAEADGLPVAFGIDCPLGLPRAFAAAVADHRDFPAFLASLATDDGGFFQVARELADVSRARPFYPARGVAGVTRASHAAALGFASATSLSRICDRATARRPAGAPVFWTLGANQSGKAAIAAWRDLVIPALVAAEQIAIWPFAGPFRTLLVPGAIVLAETYPAEALRQLGLRIVGSKRRQADRAALGASLLTAMAHAGAIPSAELAAAVVDGFGHDAAGEDRLDCVLGLLCVLGVIDGRAPDTPPAGDPWLATWEGFVLGQNELPRALPNSRLAQIQGEPR